jgi:putative membrane protein
MILRDHLAIDRTVLANERTLLAYIRTALAFLVLGGSLIKFFHDDTLLVTSGIISMVAGIIIFIIGLIRFFQIKKKINAR